MRSIIGFTADCPGKRNGIQLVAESCKMSWGMRGGREDDSRLIAREHKGWKGRQFLC
jgi:hypothetical protein